MSVYGTSNYGKTDRIPGVGHVCTQFFHINFLPLVPCGSYFIFEGVGDGDYGMKVAWSGKSILVGWVRGALMLGAVISGFVALIALLDRKGNEGVPIVLGTILAFVFVGLFYSSYKIPWIAHANYERAVFLGRTIGFNDETMLMIEVMHGRLTAEQADAELARLEELSAANAVPAEFAESEGQL